MKTSLLTLFFALASMLCHAQEQKTYECHFKVGTVETYPIAKPLISIMRHQYNTEEAPRRVNPVFDPKTHEFILTSEMPVGKEELRALLQEYSYELTDFSQVERSSK